MTRHKHLLPILIAALVFYLITPSAQHAQLQAQGEAQPQGTPANGNLQTTDGHGGSVACSTVEGAKGVLLGYIVPCITTTIATSTEAFSAQMIDFLRPPFYAFLAFVVTMFGVKVLQGGQHDIHKEGFVLLLKIALVIGILELIPHSFVPAIYGVMASSQSVVAGAIGPDGSSIHCDIAKYQGAGTPLVWAQMDCVLGKLYGFTTGSGGSHNMFLASSMFGMLTGFFFGGALGIAVFLACIGVLFSVFMLVLRSAMAFINGYLIICVMMLISPLFLPLVLLKATTNYFDPWWKNVLAGFLAPILVSSYAMFALLLYDKMLFAPDAMVNKLFEYSNVKNAQQLPKAACSKPITNNPTAARPGAQPDTLFKSPFLLNFNQPLTSGSNDICSMAQMPVFNLADGSSEFRDAKAALTKIFNDCVKLLVLGYVISAGVKLVMDAIRQLTGTSSTSALLGATTKQEKHLQKSMKMAKASAKQEMGDAKGAEFISRTVPTMGAAAKGFFTGMTQ